MDSGLSWADQWDYDTPDPLPRRNDNDKKEKDGRKSSLGKKLMSLKWMKDLRKKPQK
ncbi:hypothetical protein K2173_002678 [Erythroxylum novogranatense]|uniref:Uncharacterized protein n=1 Tax=Erythroxylum novogranatense TaxID=1862640 RepID=A0AAV8SXP5_9ROSI|nr:hypothetical protein K2173_002678 [Erythroxylum novogranatense]